MATHERSLTELTNQELQRIADDSRDPRAAVAAYILQLRYRAGNRR